LPRCSTDEAASAGEISISATSVRLRANHSIADRPSQAVEGTNLESATTSIKRFALTGKV